MRSIRVLLMAAAPFTVACDDERQPSLPLAPDAVAPHAVSAYLTVSSAEPAAGERVTVSIRARRGSAVGPIGSFTVRLAYDTARLTFLESARSEHGMALANGDVRGLVKGAGAAAGGFTDDVLLTSTFLVRSTGMDALASLALEVQELNSISFENQLANTRVERRLFRDDATKQ